MLDVLPKLYIPDLGSGTCQNPISLEPIYSTFGDRTGCHQSLADYHRSGCHHILKSGCLDGWGDQTKLNLGPGHALGYAFFDVSHIYIDHIVWEELVNL